MSSSQELFYLKWNNFQKNISTQYNKLRDNLDLIDITFACGGKKLGAHKLVLFACSPYFRDLLKENQSPHPIFFMNDVKFDILKAILDYMYLGEVHITNENLKDFIKTAESLQIRGLSRDTNNDEIQDANTSNIIRDENSSDKIQIEDYGRKRSIENDIGLPIYNEAKRIRNEEESTTILDEEEEDEDCEDIEIPVVRRKHNNHMDQGLEPKVELFGDDYLDQKPTQSTTYCNMDTFTEKNMQPEYIATTSNQVTGDYKSDDEIWDKATLGDIGNTSLTEINQAKQLSKAAKQNASAANNRANCLTPRSCPVCARVYSNVSNLRQHMRLIHNPTAAICPLCQKTFNSDLYLKRHYASIHSLNASGVEIEEGKVTMPANGTASWTTSYTSGEVTNLIQQ